MVSATKRVRREIVGAGFKPAAFWVEDGDSISSTMVPGRFETGPYKRVDPAYIS